MPLYVHVVSNSLRSSRAKQGPESCSECIRNQNVYGAEISYYSKFRKILEDITQDVFLLRLPEPWSWLSYYTLVLSEPRSLLCLFCQSTRIFLALCPNWQKWKIKKLKVSLFDRNTIWRVQNVYKWETSIFKSCFSETLSET